MNNVIKGDKELIRQLRSFGDDAKRQIEGEVEATASYITNDAKSLVPVDTGKLSQSIGKEMITTLTYKVHANESYAPYVEFGTGGLVDIPDGWGDLARLYKGKGIRKVNLPARPYLYPAFIKAKGTYYRNLNNLLENLVKRYN